MQVPARQSRLTFTLSNATGTDLYVRFGAQASTTRYDCRSGTTATTEECRIEYPVQGLWFVTVRGTAAYTGASLTGFTTPLPEPAVVVLTSGQPVSGIAVPEADVRYFSIDVPAGQARLALELTGGTGDALLLASYGDKPWTASSSECAASLRGTGASCVFNAPRAGTWFVGVQARTALAGFALQGTVTPTGDGVPVVLTPGEWSAPLSGSPTQDALFRIDVPDNQIDFVVEMAGGTGLADFYLGSDEVPTPFAYDCAGTATQVCRVYWPQAGSYFVRVRGLTTYSGVRVRGTLSSPEPLGFGAPKTGISSLKGQTRYYRFDVPVGAAGLRLATPYDSRVTLYVYQGAVHGGTQATCYQNTCYIAQPQAGAWFVALGFSADVSDTQLLVTLEDGPQAPVTDNVSLAVSAPAGSFRFYTFEVPTGVERLGFDLFSTDAASFFVQRGRKPSISDNACRGFTTATHPNSGCAFSSPQAGTWYAMVEATEDFTGQVRATTSLVPRLIDGMKEQLPSSAQNSERLWSIEVPEGRSDLLVRLMGIVGGELTASGDTALLVKRGGIPNSADNDCKSDNPDSFMETCAFVNPQPGTWYISVRGKVAYSGVHLEATHAGTPGEGVDALDNGVARLNLTDWRHAYRLWKLEVPAGQRRLEFDLSGGAGNVDMYVQYGTRPTATSYQCRALASAQGERCVIDTPQAGTWFVLARGISDFRGIYLTGRYSNDGDVVPLVPHVPMPNLSGEGQVQKLFSMTVPAGRSRLRFHLAGNLQNMQMRVKLGAVPTLTDTPCRYANQTSVGNCDITNPVAGTYYVMLSGVYQAASLTGLDQVSQQVSTIEPLLSGAPYRLEPNVTSIRYFVVAVPAGAKSLRVTTRGYPSVSTQGPTLFVRRGEVPMVQTWDCDSNNNGSNESCTFDNPQEGLWYVAIDTPHYNDVDLEATHE